MTRKVKHRHYASAITIVIALSLGNITIAAEQKESVSMRSDPVKSLENVLNQAGKQGLISIGNQAGDAQNDHEKPNSLGPDAQAPADCKVVSVLDLSYHQAVTSFADIPFVKASVKKSSSIEDILPLVKTYLALGLGTELSSMVENQLGREARLLEAIGHLIDGYANDVDQHTIKQYAECNPGSRFWALLAETINSPDDPLAKKLELTKGDLDYIEGLPENIRNHAAIQLGIYAAEQRSVNLADRILTSIDPQTKYGKLPTVKDDGLLYFFALVRQMKGDPVALEIFKNLAQYDGLYRTRSLKTLAEENAINGTTLYGAFSNDLEAVSQQYNGQSESRQAIFQLLVQTSANDKFSEAIAIAKTEFAHDDAERGAAVNLLGRRLQTNLKPGQNDKRLYALNAYLQDIPFFLGYENIEALKDDAQSAAIDLNLPELVSIILPESDKPHPENREKLAYAGVKTALKQGHYSEAVNLARPFASHPEFKPLILDAAIRSGNTAQANKALLENPADINRFEQQVSLAWKNKAWRTARIALEAISHLDPDPEITEKIALVNFVGEESRAYIDRPVPNSALELDLLSKKLSEDISLVKSYLSNG